MSGKFSSGGRLTVPVTAAAVLLVCMAIAGCGPATSSTVSGSDVPVPATAPGGGSQGSPADGSPAGGSPGAGSQGNPGFPYEPGGVTINGGAGGGVYTFSIPAGGYSENTQAMYDPATDPSGSGQCLFSGEFDYVSGSGFSAPLGGDAAITAMSPIDGPPVKLTLAAGDYKVYIYPETTCSWTIELWP